jgi:hypothetical protein
MQQLIDHYKQYGLVSWKEDEADSKSFATISRLQTVLNVGFLRTGATADVSLLKAPDDYVFAATSNSAGGRRREAARIFEQGLP